MDKLIEHINNIYDTKSFSLDISKPHIFQYLFLNHAFLVVNIVYRALKALHQTEPFKQKKIPYFVGLGLSVCTGLGSAILTSLLLGNHQIFFDNDVFLLFFIAAWTLTFFSPFDLVHLITGNLLIELVTYSFQGVFVGKLMVGGIHNAVKTFPNSVIAHLFLGGLSACGGAFLFPFFFNKYAGETKINSQFTNPTIGTIGPYLISTFYYVVKIVLKINELEVIPDVKLTPEHIVQSYFVFHFLLTLLPRFSMLFSTEPKVYKNKSKQVESQQKIKSSNKTAKSNKGKKKKE